MRTGNDLRTWLKETEDQHGDSPVLRPGAIYDRLAECPDEIKAYLLYFTPFNPMRASLALEFILPSSLYRDFKEPTIVTSIKGHELRDNFTPQEYGKALLETNCPGKSAMDMAGILKTSPVMTRRELAALSGFKFSDAAHRPLLNSRADRKPGQRGRSQRLFYITNPQALRLTGTICTIAEFNETTPLKGTVITTFREKYQFQRYYAEAAQLNNV
jgi:hypothetical protein